MIITGERAAPQQGPFCHCKACHAPLKSGVIEETLQKRQYKAQVTEAGERYMNSLNDQIENYEYAGAYEELCPRCLEAAFNPPAGDGVELDGLYWERETEAVMQKYYDSLELDTPWAD